MIASIEIQNLRGIRTARLDGLTPLTVLVGGNASGKSTVLEGVGVGVAADAGAAFEVLAAREWLGLEGMIYWFPEGVSIVRTEWKDGGVVSSIPREVHLREQPLNHTDLDHLARNGKAGEHRVLALDSMQRRPSGSWRALIDSRGAISVSYLQRGDGSGRSVPLGGVTAPSERRAGSAGASSDRLGLDAAKRNFTYDALLDALRVIKPRLKMIDNIGVGSGPLIEPHVFEQEPDAFYPLANAGQGMREAVGIAGALGAARAGICLLDEPESHGHPSLLRKIAEMIRKSVRDGTQVFIATQSLEFIEVLAAQFEEIPDQWSVFGLRLDAGVLGSQKISGERALVRLLDLGDDLRL